MKARDFTGQRFGKLVAMYKTQSKQKSNSKSTVSYWLLHCDCGNDKELAVSDFAYEKGYRSCGCAHYTKGEDHFSYKHGYRHDILYGKFFHIRDRCYNPKTKNYRRYGGRGITIHQPWLDNPALFVDYMRSLYEDPYALIEQGYSIDRINNDGNYEPGNIKLATQTEQSRNKSNNKILDVFGETLTLVDAVEQHSTLDYGTVQYRLSKNWNPEKALKEPALKGGLKPVDYDKPYIR